MPMASLRRKPSGKIAGTGMALAHPLVPALEGLYESYGRCSLCQQTGLRQGFRYEKGLLTVSQQTLLLYPFPFLSGSFGQKSETIGHDIQKRYKV
jgi:hypothetical protein